MSLRGRRSWEASGRGPGGTIRVQPVEVAVEVRVEPVRIALPGHEEGTAHNFPVLVSAKPGELWPELRRDLRREGPDLCVPIDGYDHKDARRVVTGRLWPEARLELAPAGAARAVAARRPPAGGVGRPGRAARRRQRASGSVVWSLSWTKLPLEISRVRTAGTRGFLRNILLTSAGSAQD